MDAVVFFLLPVDLHSINGVTALKGIARSNTVWMAKGKWCISSGDSAPTPFSVARGAPCLGAAPRPLDARPGIREAEGREATRRQAEGREAEGTPSTESKARSQQSRAEGSDLEGSALAQVAIF